MTRRCCAPVILSRVPRHHFIAIKTSQVLRSAESGTKSTCSVPIGYRMGVTNLPAFVVALAVPTALSTLHIPCATPAT